MFSFSENMFERIKNYQGGEDDDAGTYLKSRVEKGLCVMLSGATSGIWRGPL